MGRDGLNGKDRVIQASYMVSVAIALGMVLSVAVYVFVALLLVGKGQVFIVPEGGSLRLVLVAAAVLSAAGGVGIFRTQRSALTGATHSLSPEEALSRLLRARIVGLALAETAAIMGLVLTLTTAEMSWSYALSGLALGAMVLLWPKRRQLERAALPEEVRSIEPQ